MTGVIHKASRGDHRVYFKVYPLFVKVAAMYFMPAGMFEFLPIFFGYRLYFFLYGQSLSHDALNILHLLCKFLNCTQRGKIHLYMTYKYK